MHIGACGLLCMMCREFVHGLCEGCVRGDLCSPEMAVSSPCAVLRCAAARRIAYCSHDCSEFPCALMQAHLPTCWLSAEPPYPPANPLAARRPGHHSEAAGEQPDHDGLRVYCLGKLRVFRNGTELLDGDWGQGRGPTQKIKAMLAYLLFRGQHGARKETLMDLLWPEQKDYARASDSFHQALHCLRRALEPEMMPGELSSYVSHEDDRYCFHPVKPVWVDADVFLVCCREAQKCATAGDHQEALLHWVLAVDLYHGDYLADLQIKYIEDPDFNWCLPRRLRLRLLYRTALQQVIVRGVIPGEAISQDTGLGCGLRPS